ncbi:MAG: carbamate kinase [Bacteroidales bacterium]|nr:carbamate kinase [Bacteroidales bacterium]
MSALPKRRDSIGYMIEQQLRNVLLKEKLERDILTLVTQVVVAKDDPAFKNPTKPVGPYYKKEEADKLTETNKWVFHEDPRGRGWRRVVPSPKPHQINNTFSIEKMARDGSIVVTVGGGGVPAFYVEKDKLQGIDAVIDKDLASAKLATEIHAEEFYILTDVPKVCINFNAPQEQQLDMLTVSDAKKYLENKEFAEGSMAPKIRAAIQFIEEGGEKCVITESSQLGKPEAGTQLIADK